MVSKLSKLWKLFATPETVDKVADASEKVFELAETLNDKDNKNNKLVKELVGQIPTLLEPLNSPLGQVVKSSVPFLPIATGIIQFAIEVNKKEPTVAETVALVSQVAYLESIKETIPEEIISSEPIDREFKEVRKQLNRLAELEIDYKEATLALVYFHESKLAKAFGEILSIKLDESSRIDESNKQIWLDKVSKNTQQQISKALAEAGEDVKVVRTILDWYLSGGREEFTKWRSINYYLEQKVKSLPEENVFKEKFTYRDIYVPLKALLLDLKGNEIKDEAEFILEEWTKKIIQNSDEADKVLFVQAGAGRGKSVFCRMFADWVRKNLHPVITPIVVRLRDISNYNRPIHEILTDALSTRHFVNNDSGWLTDPNTRYLFLLDGFDELRMEGRASGGIQEFIQQVGLFQQDSNSKEAGHRIIVTGRPIALQGIPYLPSNLKRVQLLPMDEEIQSQWFDRWSRVAIPDNPIAGIEEADKFLTFLAADNCPKEIKEKLAREPLLLYLLGKLHREKAIQKEDFEGTGNQTNAKILVYEKSLELVLKEQREEWVQYQATGLDIESLERILMEAGLCVVQSGGEYARVGMIETRLEKDDAEAAQIIKTLRTKSENKEKSGEKALTTALGAFYIRSAGEEKGGGVEFYHKSFSEFLCAKRIQQSLESWTTLVKVTRQQQWFITRQQLAEQIYDLLGYGGLTSEIVEYLWGLLSKSDEFSPVKLFQRLLDFYLRWCDGEFIDAEETVLPHLKMKELKKQIPERKNYLGQRQVDVYAGLNIMILLLELHRYGQSQTEDIKQKLIFHPSGKPNAQGQLADETLLKRLLNYGDCFADGSFRDTLRRFLEGANLYGTNLYGTSLYSSNLDGASLRSASLRGASLKKASLKGANLVIANFSGADFSGANLEDACLSGANLEDANLEGANLEGANLSDANLEGANLSDVNLAIANLDRIRWNSETQWANIRGLDQARNVSEDLRRELDEKIE
ncbi:MAG: pentapeptide repeat-containing protein [Cyanobacteria bacterium J06643_13]